MARKPNPGTVYLLHFDKPIGNHAQHYIGWAKHLAGRIQHHRNGTGARLTQVAVELQISFDVVATWEGDRHFERMMKNRKNAKRYCPICKQKH